MNTSTNLDSLKKYLLPLVTIIVVIVLVPLLIMPSVGDIQTAYQKSQQEQQLSTQLADKISKLQGINNDDNLQKLNQLVEPAVPSDPDPAGLLGSLEQITYSSGANTKSSSYSQTGTTSDSGEINATIVVEGGYANIAKFVSQVENASRIVSINTMNLSVPSTGGTTVSANFEISSPYENVSSLGAPETPLPQDLSKTDIYTKLGNLTHAAYSPTPVTQIPGKDNPF